MDSVSSYQYHDSQPCYSHISFRYEEEGPTVNWYTLQRFLYDANGDVLVLLDCCNSALITSGKKKSGKFELLSATAKGRKTPGPGRWSFTSVLVKEIRKGVKNKGQVHIRDLQNLLLENPKITGMLPRSASSFTISLLIY